VEVRKRGREEMPGSQNGAPRPRPAKAETIHGLARGGDLAGVQRKLRENPALLNDKNPVVRADPFSYACLGENAIFGRFHGS
jgi:hypothetical protein